MFGLDTGALGLALGAGMLAAVNPCGFALLPAYLTLFVLDDKTLSPLAAVGRAVRATSALTVGFAGVFLVFGLLVLPVAASVQAYLPAFTVILGLALALSGGWVAAGRKLPTPRLPRGRAPAASGPLAANWKAMIGFGASYAVASLGCTLAPFLAVVLTSFRAANPLAGLMLFATYAAGMGITVGAAAVAVALARRGIVTSMRKASGTVPRIAGGILAVTGLYVAWYGVWELRVLHFGAGSDPVVDAAAHVRLWAVSGVEAVRTIHPAAVFALLAVAALQWRMATKKGTGMNMQAIFNGVVIAESDDTIVVEGNHYFPRESLNDEYIEPSRAHSVCMWKGVASYYNVRVDDAVSTGAAWYYPKPSPLARKIKNRVAFWQGVQVRPAPQQPAGPEPESFDAPEGATC